MPTNGPVIEGIDPPYQIDDIVNISCTAGPSKPTAHMKWFINEMEVCIGFSNTVFGNFRTLKYFYDRSK